MTAGIGAIVAIFITDNTARENAGRNYNTPALAVLILLLINLLVAAGYAWFTRTLREADPIQAASFACIWLAAAIFVWDLLRRQ